MGCWYETCALTLLPILEDDPCVLLIFKVSDKLVYAPTNRSELLPNLIACYEGAYDDYGGIKGPDLDQYRESLEGHSYRFVFFHESAYEKALNLSEGLADWQLPRADWVCTLYWYFQQDELPHASCAYGRFKFKDLPQHIKDIGSVLSVCSVLRRFVIGNGCMSGSQATDHEMHVSVAELTNEIAQNQIAKSSDYDDEEE
jgi:hypothetical protein